MRHTEPCMSGFVGVLAPTRWQQSNWTPHRSRNGGCQPEVRFGRTCFVTSQLFLPS